MPEFSSVNSSTSIIASASSEMRLRTRPAGSGGEGGRGCAIFSRDITHFYCNARLSESPFRVFSPSRPVFRSLLLLLFLLFFLAQRKPYRRGLLLRDPAMMNRGSRASLELAVLQIPIFAPPERVSSARPSARSLDDTGSKLSRQTCARVWWLVYLFT